VRLLSRWAVAVGGCFEETRFYLRRRNLVLTGMPLRRELIDAAHSPALPSTSFRILVTGGSRGAHRLNEIVTEALIQLHRDGLPVTVTHLTGEQDFAEVSQRYRDAGVEADARAFTREMGLCYASADFVICRAGAATCAELSTFGLPSLLIPYPHAIHDHQTANARAMEKVGAADMVPERDLTVEWLVSYVKQAVRQVERRRQMAAAARAYSSLSGAERLAHLVIEVARDASHAVAR
jgi:UDP-N-acetylglucosamine--N-acetylmuramyl-(pentapeptide) pyrophosphoryl-undecaprenol N-acetylglucosamine transferase